MSDIRDPFVSLPGAVSGEGADAGVPAHYGNPFVEQRQLAEGRAIVDLSHRAVLSVAGPDRLTWIDSVTSQSVRGLAAGDSAETLLLDANGRLEYAVKLIDDGATLWMLIDADDAPGLLAWLRSMRFMLRVEPADRTAEFATVGAIGDSRVAAAAPNGVRLVWNDPWQRVATGGWQYASDDDHPAHDWRWTESLVERASLDVVLATWLEAGGAVAGSLAAEALRIAAWRPRAAAEVDERTIPHELDWLRTAVHLSKGCYRGQETVAKVHNLGHPPRRLVMLHLDGSEGALPDAGAEVLLAGVGIGRITSSARHFELGPIALAVIRRTTDESADLTVRAGDTLVAAGQQVIVPASAGAVADVPRLPRLGAVSRSDAGRSEEAGRPAQTGPAEAGRSVASSPAP